ncbi:hypothetical protein ACFQZC_19500 [Streptacidiphilus monticola]
MTHPARTARLLVAAAFTTALGNNVQLIAGALLLVREQHTMTSVGWLFVAVALPQALLSPPSAGSPTDSTGAPCGSPATASAPPSPSPSRSGSPTAEPPNPASTSPTSRSR